MDWDDIVTFFRDKATYYRLTFRKDQPANCNVLADLAVFCFAHRSTHHADPYIAARYDGRREVWLHIQKHLSLKPEEIARLATGNPAAIYERTENE